jgi:hypothetical protein
MSRSLRVIGMRSYWSLHIGSSRDHPFDARNDMKNFRTLSLILLAGVLLGACSENLDPLSPGTTVGKYSIGIKALVPLAIGNQWTYGVVVYDTSGTERARYTYSMAVIDSVSADTNLIPLVPPSTNHKGLTRSALVWYRVQGELGAMTCWQVDTLENLRIRKADDTRFYEQTAFDFRATIGSATPTRSIGADTSLWASGDIVVTAADSVRSTLVSKGVDTLRTTLGSAPYFQYRASYVTRTDYTDHYFKPGFGLILIERFQRKADGSMVCVRRDKLASYYFR